MSNGVRDRGRKLQSGETGGSLTVDPVYPDVWWARSSRDNDRRYRVQMFFVTDEDGTHVMTGCTCAHGLNNMGHAKCYHVSAVLERALDNYDLKESLK